MSLEDALEVCSESVTATLTPYQTTPVPAGARWCTVRAVQGDAAPFMFVTPPEHRNNLAVQLVAAGVDQARVDAFMEQF